VEYEFVLEKGGKEIKSEKGEKELEKLAKSIDRAIMEQK